MKQRNLSTILLSGALFLGGTAHGQVRTQHHPDFPPQTQRFSLGGAAPSPSINAVESYTVRDFSGLKGMRGFSDQALDIHFKLYSGYVKNTNLLLKELAWMRENGEMQGPYFNELKRRFGWEFDGMRLHELYFENLGGDGSLDRASRLYAMLERDFGSYGNWEKDFLATGAMRGIGWVVLYLDPKSGLLVNDWINEHDVGHLAGGTPLLVMDVWEHAYMVDYGINRGDYMDSFLRNIDWSVVEKRLRN